MSSAAYNLSRKFEWMARRLRKIDDVVEIKEWIAAMSAINTLLKEFEFKEYRNTWQPWRKKGKKKMEIDDDCNDNAVPQNPDVIVDLGTGIQNLQFPLMPTLRSPVGLKSVASNGLWLSRQRETRGKKRGIKDVSIAVKKKPVCRIEAEDGNRKKADDGKDPLTENKAATDNEDRLDGDATKKIKDVWRDALRRRLKVEGKAQEHWCDSEIFEKLLCAIGEDHELLNHLGKMFPKWHGNQFLVISKIELREYLYEEMINFYAGIALGR